MRATRGVPDRHDYRFDSSRIEQAYGLRATSYRDGIAATRDGA